MIANCPWLPHYSNNPLPRYHPAWCQCLVSAASSATCASARRLERSIANLTVYNSPRYSRIKSYQPIGNMQLNWNCILFAPQPLSPQWNSCFLEALASFLDWWAQGRRWAQSHPETKHQLWRIQVTANGLQHIPLDLSWAAKGSGATMASNEWWKSMRKLIHFEVKLDKTCEWQGTRTPMLPCSPPCAHPFPTWLSWCSTYICFGSFNLTQPFYNFLLLLHILPPFLQLCSLFFYKMQQAGNANADLAAGFNASEQSIRPDIYSTTH